MTFLNEERTSNLQSRSFILNTENSQKWQAIFHFFIFAFELPFLKLFKTSLFGSHTFLNTEARNGKDNVLFTCYSPFSHCYLVVLTKELKLKICDFYLF